MSINNCTVGRAAHDETEVGAHRRLLLYSLKPQGTDIFLRDTSQQQSAKSLEGSIILAHSLCFICLPKIQMSPACFQDGRRICVSKKKQQHSSVDAQGAVLFTLNHNDVTKTIKGQLLMMTSTHPKSSFWLRVRQVSGKQAMFPRIPTQIS